MSGLVLVAVVGTLTYEYSGSAASGNLPRDDVRLNRVSFLLRGRSVSRAMYLLDVDTVDARLLSRL